MLGRWDATNIVDSEVVVVTNVECDHMDLAGPTLTHVAAEKAGIIRPQSTLVLGDVDPQLYPVFEAHKPKRILRYGADFGVSARVATQTGSLADLTTPSRKYPAVTINMLGAHQGLNAAVAVTAAEAFLGPALHPADVRQAIATVRLPGRAEVIQAQHPTVLLDGAHNPAAAQVLRNLLKERSFAANRRVLVCGMTGGRDPMDFLRAIGPADVFDSVIATEPPVPHPTSVSAAALASAARRLGIDSIEIPTLGSAMRSALSLAGPDGLVVATGSLHLIEFARKQVTRNEPSAVT